MSVLCGIVTYRPDKSKLNDCVFSIIEQVEKILIIDNTPGGYDFNSKIKQNDKIIIQTNNKNLGIACALGQIMCFAIKYEYSYVLTLDQDSVAENGLISIYKDYWSIVPNDVGALTSLYRDNNTGVSDLEKDEYYEVKYCITSGFYINVDAYKCTSGYDSWMFIDRVDWDICYLLEEMGYKIYCVPVVGISHEIGKGKDVYLLGKHLIVSNHVPWRRYYMARNGVYLAKKHKSYMTVYRAFRKELLIIIMVFIYEDKKFKKLWYGLKGLYKGMTAKVNKQIGDGDLK